MLIVHDYLTQRGGAERVVLSMLRAFPEAKLVTSIYAPSTTFPEFQEHDVQTLWTSRVGLFRREHRAALPVLAPTFSAFTTDEDVLCSSSGWAHGVRTTGRKTVYCYTPPRWVYAPQSFAGGRRSTTLALRAVAPPLRAWDRRAAATADTYLTSSRAVAARIRAAYGIEAELLPPPMTLAHHPRAHVDLGLPPRYALVVSRLLPYKNVDVALDACRRLGVPLVVVGRGPDKEALVRRAAGAALFLEGLSEPELDAVYRGAEVLLAPAHEDFGLTPLEAGARGVPVVALAEGGYLDTVVDGVTGLLYLPGGLEDAIATARDRVWDRDAIRTHADGYVESRFQQRLRDVVGVGSR